LDPVVRPYFVRTVCINGPESCGKSTLAQRLAEHYRTIWQPEFAREWLGERHCVYEDMEPIAEGHLRERERYKQTAKGILFVDTDAITTKVFSERYYGRCPRRVEEIITLPENRNDLCLLLKPDVPWVKDTSRDLGEPVVREEMYERFQRALADCYGGNYVSISGTWQERFDRAVAAVDGLLARSPQAFADWTNHRPHVG
jgi:HTH-type transcriptional repressor of NAD biosynthesis genes